ncbi:9cb36506-b9e8-4ace-92a0-8b8f8db35782 [Thermothielavioides terrestris]|uniref:9cb36506-b9e8-4ace-92a0-8b8f8db35782 n=1 Tax=Thermothielavioides terrestris TaxID=2587410 RepID=A0A446BYM0_9PEZI|nr:9cb36506-b9e8-4ace-92a0-8b8f8db35782 [Thermothielavioides terrestris]
MLSSKPAVSGLSWSMRVQNSISQDPAFEIQILPAMEASYSSSALVDSAHAWGSTIEKELERHTDGFGFFPATLKLPRSTDTVGMTIPSKLKA